MARSQKNVAILLATYNGKEFIDEQINSICWQTHEHWHLFVRDDGSKDGTVDAICQIVDPDRLTVIDPSFGRGGTPAKNFFSILACVDMSRFDFIAFSDQDDIWGPRKLARAIECMDTAGAGGYSSNMIPFDNTQQTSWFLKKSYPEKQFDYIFQGASAGCTYVLNRSCALLIQEKLAAIMAAPPVGFSHDWTVYAISRSFGQKWFQDSEAHIFYRQHSRNAFGAMPNYAGLLQRLRLARSGWYRSNIIWLGGMLRGSEAETAILDRLKRFSFTDRVWLARNRDRFRRRQRDSVLFGIIAICGLI